MDIDPTKNIVVFEIQGRDEPHIAEVPTRDDDGIRQAWSGAQAGQRVDARKVTRIHSEWQPSAADADFIRRTFPRARLTYNFERPGPDGWEAAFAAARQELEQQESEHAARNMEHVAEHGELVPILWSQASPAIQMLQALPHRSLASGKLHVALATVAMTPENRIGMNHVGRAGLDGRPFDDLLAEAFGALGRGLRIEGLADPGRSGEMALVQRQGPFASSAVALPDFHAQMSAALRDDRLLVGLPDPDTALVTPMDSGWAEELQRLVLTSPCDSRELVPCVLALEPGAIRFVAERSR